MFAELCTFIITIILGPGVFLFFSNFIYPNTSLKFPISYFDGISDIFLLPCYNAVAVYLGIFGFFSKNILVISFIISLFFVASCYLYIKYTYNLIDWGMRKKGVFNIGGWYHLLFMLFQLVFIIYSLIIFYKEFILWIPLILFMILMLIYNLELQAKKIY